jgi:peptidyl-tRNA hydrolase
MDRPDETPELTEKRKMYVVVRGDLPPGLRAAQAGHAIAEACLMIPHAADDWHEDPEGNYLIILEVPDEKALLAFWSEVKSWDIRQELFREPDMALEATAFAALPPPDLNHVFAVLPLAYTKRRWGARFRRWIGLRPA